MFWRPAQTEQNQIRADSLSHFTQTAQLYLLSDLSSPSLQVLGKDKGEKQGLYTRAAAL